MLAQERGCLVQKESVYLNLLCNQYLFSQCKNITAPTEPVIFTMKVFLKMHLQQSNADFPFLNKIFTSKAQMMSNPDTVNSTPKP